MNPYTIAVRKIEDANLSPNIYRTARRLLDCVDPEFGHIRLSKPEIMVYANTDAYNTARSHLVKLQRSGVIHYSVNGDVYVNFSAWQRAPHDHPRAPHDHSKEEGKEERAPHDHPRAPHDHITEEKLTSDHDVINVITTRSPTRATRSLGPLPIGYWLVGSIDHIDPSTEPNQPVQTQTETANVSEGEQQQSYELLIDEDLMALVSQKGNHEEKARSYAQKHSFIWLLQHVCSFWIQYQAGQVRSIGALYNRIEKGWRPENWADEFLASSLYKRHYPLTRREAESRQRSRIYDPNAQALDPILDILPMPFWDEDD